MESPSPLPLARYIPHQSRKRVFPGSSSSYLGPEVVEISPPLLWSSKSKSLKQKEIIHHEVIDIDMDDESEDIMLIDKKVHTCSKGKEALANFSRSHSYSSKTGSVDGVQPSKKSYVPGLNNSLILKGFSKDFSHGYDEFLDTYHDNLTYDDEYAFLQAHFDSIDIPPGVEAPIPWFSGPTQDEKNSATVNNLNRPNFPISLGASGTGSSHSWGLSELAKFKKTSGSLSSSSLNTGTKNPQSMPVPPSSSYSESALNKKKSVTSISSTYLNSQMERVKSRLDRVAGNYQTRSKSGPVLGYSHTKKKTSLSGKSINYASNSRLDAMQLSSGMESSIRGPSLRSRLKKPVDNADVIDSKFPTMDALSLPPGVDPYMSGWQHSDGFMDKLSLVIGGIHNSPDGVFLSEKELYPPWVQDLGNSQMSATAAGSSTAPPGSMSPTERSDDIPKKFQTFKQFDMVQDHTDHHHSSKDFSSKQPSKNWAKKIQDEWRILEKDLPDTIFVRVYESRMDLLRAVIIGAEGTPYHDGLFFFDVFFPCGYPNVPPLVYYHSGGLRINPNLYACGKVCLSLLNTWGGNSNEKWIPGVSTMLQVLVSIQALILNEKPYFNEPGYARMSGSASGEKNSQQYNENTLILSLRTMVYTMRKPPKHFEDFVLEHFRKHTQDIFGACKAYMEGVQVGCLVRGGVQDVDAGNNCCSQHFKDTLASFITMLVQTFTQIGATDCEKFLSLKGEGK